MQGMFGEVWNLWKIQSQVHLKTMAWGSLKPNHIVVRIRWGGYPHAALHAELQLSCDSLFQVLWCRGKGCYGQWWRWNTLLIYETKLSSDWSTVISSHLWCKCLHWEHQRLKKKPLIRKQLLVWRFSCMTTCCASKRCWYQKTKLVPTTLQTRMHKSQVWNCRLWCPSPKQAQNRSWVWTQLWGPRTKNIRLDTQDSILTPQGTVKGTKAILVILFQ